MVYKEFFSCPAGNTRFNETTGEVTPLPAPGRLVLRESSEDPSLRSIIWVPTQASMSELTSQELMVLPGDVEFERVPYCKTGRVISMKFLSSSQKHFFWLQKAVNDEDDLNTFTEDDENNLKTLTILANEEVDFEEEEEEEEEEDAEAEASADKMEVTEPAEAGDVTPENRA